MCVVCVCVSECWMGLTDLRGYDMDDPIRVEIEVIEGWR